MEIRAVIKRATGPAPSIAFAILLLGAVLLLTAAAQHSEILSDHFSILVIVNLLGILILALLIGANLWRLVRQFRSGILGSRFTIRLLITFALLAILPLSVVYYFSVQFLSKGIDSWFDVRIEQALDDALLLGRASLEAFKNDQLRQVQEDAVHLSEVDTQLEIVQLLDDLREQGGYFEINLYTQSGSIIASSSLEAQSLVPDAPDDMTLSKIRKGQVHAELEPLSGGGLQLRTAVPVHSRGVSQPVRVLQVLQPLTLRYARLGQSVQSARDEYERLAYLRDPLKFSFILALTLITLVATLIAMWAAIWSSRRLVAPLRDLAEGTRAVAAGDYNKRLPVTSGDELGILVQSFNDMTRQVYRAQNHARRSQHEAEQQRTYLETVLSHLSSGVLSFDHQHRLRTQNTAAKQVLNVKFDKEIGSHISTLHHHHPWIEPLVSAVENSMQRELAEWQAEVILVGGRGRQVLMCRGTRLPGRGLRGGGYVVVFDDITDLIQAQRDAAWGEVARRLAHEIKNPLTPIQLSAERIRHKYLDKLDPSDRPSLDRATRTIVQQVESMKLMVNAFSNYAQPARMNPEPIDLNHLIHDVVELHKQTDKPINIILNLDKSLDRLTADPDRIRQVLNNLIINTRDVLAEVSRPKLTISTRRITRLDNKFAELSIIDNGPGFPDDMLGRIFEPYVTTKEKGTGLGLAIVKRIVEEHGGTLWAENIDARGASITIQLPLDLARDANVTDPNIKITRLRAVGHRKQ